MEKTTEDAPTEVPSPEGPVSLADDQHLSNGRQSSSGVHIKTECAVSTTEDVFRNSQSSSGGFNETENAPGEDCVGSASETMFASESGKPVSIVDFLNKSQSSSVNTKALPSTTSCCIDILTIEKTISLGIDVAERNESASGLDGKNKISASTEQFKQPPRKKTKLSRSIQVPVKDLLNGIHTSICKQDCTFKHSPLVLAICVPDDHELKDYLENHWKLVMTNHWKSAQYSLDPKSMDHWVTQLVHLTVLFGKYELLKFLLRVHLGCSDLCLNSAQNSPLHTILKCMHHYMPSSSHQEKFMAFQHILHNLAKYNCNILLVRDMPKEDTVLHVCAKKIKELTNQMQSIQSHGHDELKLQGLLNQRQLLDSFFKEMIHTLKRLCADGSLHYNQVIELFDCVNNAGETMSQILKEDESARNDYRFLASQVASTLHEEANTECATQQKIVAEKNSVNVTTEEDISQLGTGTVARSSHSCATQNENAHVLTQAANPSDTETFCTNHLSVVTTESPSMRTTQIVTSTQTENSTGIITLSTNNPSVQVATGCPNQVSSTTESTSQWPEKTVENSVETTILSTEYQSAQTPNGSPKQSLSTTECVLLSPAKSANQVANSIQTTILSTECQSVQAADGFQKQPASTTVSVSVRLPQTVVSTQVANPLGSTTFLTDCSSGQAPSGSLKQSTSNVRAASITVPSKTVDLGAQAMQTMPVDTERQQSGIGFL